MSDVDKAREALRDLDDCDFLEVVKQESDRRQEDEVFSLKDRNYHSMTDRFLLMVYLVLREYE